MRVLLRCRYCNKNFLIFPYLLRKTNYCSRGCYWNSTRRKQLKKCKVCGRSFYIKKYLVDRGFGFYCSKKCWFRLFEERKKKVTCRECKREFLVLRSVYKKNPKYCSKKCRDDSMRDYVSRICRKCKKRFELPRSDLNRGRGSFCTHRCFFTYRGPSSLEKKMGRALNLAGIKFKREVKFKRFHVDFLLEDKKSIIECDGEFWHLKPEIKERDKRKEKLLSSMGYKVIRFSGKTINKFSHDVLAKMVIETASR